MCSRLDEGVFDKPPLVIIVVTIPHDDVGTVRELALRNTDAVSPVELGPDLITIDDPIEFIRSLKISIPLLRVIDLNVFAVLDSLTMPKKNVGTVVRPPFSNRQAIFWLLLVLNVLPIDDPLKTSIIRTCP
jgi:hypothetical protein